MKPKTKENVYQAFIGEAKAYFRLLAYAQKAEEEEVPRSRCCSGPLPKRSGSMPRGS